jgi:two-component system KDP operon response regulator KdpE
VSSPGPLVLVVDDELPMRRFLRASLESNGFRVIEADSAAAALAVMTNGMPDVVLLDLGLLDLDGVELTRKVRAWSPVPIVVISARGLEEHKVEAIDAGADDYLTKPFEINELLTRVRIVLRHTHRSGGPDPSVLEIGALRIDLARSGVAVADREVQLTPIEFRILALLAHNAGRVLTHRRILKELGGRVDAEQTQHLRVCVAQLRRKVEADPARPKILVTEPGVGYRLLDPASHSVR